MSHKTVCCMCVCVCMTVCVCQSRHWPTQIQPPWLHSFSVTVRSCQQRSGGPACLVTGFLSVGLPDPGWSIPLHSSHPCCEGDYADLGALPNSFPQSIHPPCLRPLFILLSQLMPVVKMPFPLMSEQLALHEEIYFVQMSNILYA